jgi:hypothetical protein
MATLDAVTLPEVKTALGIDGTAEDAALARLITATTLEVERALRTQFVQRSVVEYHPGECRRFYVQVVPIASVTSVVDPAGTTCPSTQYVVRQKRYIEHWGHFFNAFTSAGQVADWTVTYTAGWFASTAAVTADVKAEIIRAIAAAREAPNAGVSSVGVGDLSISYAAGQAATGGSMPAHVEAAAAALVAYRGVLL